jgi:hypothetical protein
MIQKELLSIDWINRVSKEHNNADKVLVEKVIRALLLAEGLAKQKFPFIFKGGTALMLLMKTTKRLSIDIDIILPGTPEDFNEILDNVCIEQGFIRKELQHRTAQTKIIKEHYKFFYMPIYRPDAAEESVLLDILNEEMNYQNVIKIPVDSSFVPTANDKIFITIPCAEDFLGDKLTAFAPNTTGIPYFKGEDSMSMEIIKQLYDIGNLFDIVNDEGIVLKTFSMFVSAELSYRNLQDASRETVLEDIYQTSLCISLRGKDGKGDFEQLLSGIQRVGRFIFSERYHLDKAIIHASKAAYLSLLIKSGNHKLEKFNSPLGMVDWTIKKPLNPRLNRLKNSNPEAFFYWYKCYTLLEEPV